MLNDATVAAEAKAEAAAHRSTLAAGFLPPEMATR